MFLMKFLSFLIVFVCTIPFSLAQENSDITFPDTYFGTYIGDLEAHTDKGINNYPMEFHLLPTDTIGVYNYTIVYGKGEARQERKYTLKEIDKANGNYILDENNGIILDSKVIGNKMYFLFEVMDSFLTTFITFHKDYLVFEIVVSNIKSKKTSGGMDEDTPEVFSYPISVVQKAVLNKQ